MFDVEKDPQEAFPLTDGKNMPTDPTLAALVKVGALRALALLRCCAPAAEEEADAAGASTSNPPRAPPTSPLPRTHHVCCPCWRSSC